MTTPAALLAKAQAEGVILAMYPPDKITLRGDPEIVARWLPELRPHKIALLAMLTGYRTPDPKDPDAHDPLRDLYREWLDGIDEPCALVVLDRDQIRAAIAANVVAVDVVKTSVLLVYRSPLGAVGMLAIPLEKYDGFALMRAWEALQWEH